MKYIEGAVKAILEGSSSVTGLLGAVNEIHVNIIPKEAQFPSIAIIQEGYRDTRVKGEAPRGPAFYTLSISAWADDLETAKDIMRRVKEELNGLSGNYFGFNLRITKDTQEGLREGRIGPEGLDGEAHDYTIRHNY